MKEGKEGEGVLMKNMTTWSLFGIGALVFEKVPSCETPGPVRRNTVFTEQDSLCVGCDIVQADHAPEAGVCTGDLPWNSRQAPGWTSGRGGRRT